MPQRRPKPPEEEKQEDAKEGAEGPEMADNTEKEEDCNYAGAKEEKDVARDQFSTVLYGLPNQMVTLLSWIL